MKRNFPGIDRVMTLALSAILVLPSLAFSQTAPPMSGGYKDVIPIPVDDPTTKAIAGALFKPVGKGPFPGVVYMSGPGPTYPGEIALERTVLIISSPKASPR